MRQVRYREIADQLRAQIAAGAYRPGDKLPTEMELAALHGVSRVTSAAALSALAREGLVRRLPRRGTIVAVATPSAVGGRPMVAWIQPSIDHAFGLELLQGIEQATRQSGYNLLFHLTGNSREEEEQAIRNAVAAGAAGIALWLQDGETYNGEVLRLVLDKFPLVLVDRYLRGVECATVQSDNVAGAREVVAELVRAGHRQICALLYPPKDTSTIEDRLEGYTQALTAAGIPGDRSLLYVEQQIAPSQSGWLLSERVIERYVAYLHRKPEITAVFATNASLALLALRAADRLGRGIPNDLSVVCIDPLQAFPLTLPTFTYARQQGFEIGATAVELLHEQLAGGLPRRVMLPMCIEHGASVAPPRVAAPA